MSFPPLLTEAEKLALHAAMLTVHKLQEKIPATKRLEMWALISDGYCTTCGKSSLSVLYINRCHCKVKATLSALDKELH